MNITEFSFPCNITITVYGYQVKLMSVVDGAGLLFTAAIRKDEIQLNYTELPNKEKEILENELHTIKNPNDASKSISKPEVNKIIKALNRIDIQNFGLFWDKKNSRTLFYLDLKLNLVDTISLFDGNIELDFLTLDLIIASSDKDIEKEDRARKEKIRTYRKTIWEIASKEQEIQKLFKKFNEKESLIAGLKENFNKLNKTNFAETLNQGYAISEETRNKFEATSLKNKYLQEIINTSLGRIVNKFNNDNAIQSQAALIKNKDVEKNNLVENYFSHFNDDQHESFDNKIAVQNASVLLEKEKHTIPEIDLFNISIQNELAITREIEQLKEANQEKFRALKEVKDFKF